MTREEFKTRFRHRLLGLLGDAWGSRRLPPTEYGCFMEGQLRQMNELTEQMYDALQPPRAPLPAPALPPPPPKTPGGPPRKEQAK